MSYSVSARGSSKTEAKQNLALQLSGVLGPQPIHQADIDQAQAAANSFIDVLPDDESKDISVTVSGSLSWEGMLPDVKKITSASVQVYASLIAKE